MTKPIKYLEEFYKDIYWKEIDRRDKFIASLTLPVGIVTVLAGAIVYYVLNFPSFKKDFLTISFLITFLGMVLSILVSIFFLIRAFYGHNYADIPSPKKIEKYVFELQDYYQLIKDPIKDPDIETLIENDFHTLLTSEYAEQADITYLSTLEKSLYLHYARKWIVISIIFSILTIIPFGILHHSKLKMQNAGVTNLK